MLLSMSSINNKGFQIITVWGDPTVYERQLEQTEKEIRSIAMHSCLYLYANTPRVESYA